MNANTYSMKRFTQHILLGALFLVGTMAWAAPALSATTTLTLDPVAVDNIIDELENNDNLFLTGTTAETSLTVTLNQKTYTAVISGGTFRFTIPSADITTLPEGNNTITFTGGSGLVFTRIVQHVTSGVLLNVNPIAGDNNIDATEEANPIVVSGTAANVSDGSTVAITLNGNSLSATLMGGAWSINLAAADFLNGNNILTFSVTDVPSGESATTSATVTYDTLAGINILPIAGDDVYTALEKVTDNTLLIKGNVVDVEAGQTVTLTFNGVDYPTTVDAALAWSVTLSAAVIDALSTTSYTLVATTSDLGGNVGTTSRTLENEAQPDVIIDINPNSYVAGQTGVVTFTFRSDVSGFTAANVTPENASIAPVNMISSTVYTTVLTPDASINQATNTLTVDSAWTFDNSATLSAATYPSSPYALNTLTPQLSVASVTSDNSIGSTEDDAAVSITGTSTFLEDGTALSLTLAGGTYATTINANAWSVSIPAGIVQTLNQVPTANTLSVVATSTFGASTGAVSHSFVYDPNAQSEDLLITIDKTVFGTGDTALVTYSFRSPVTNFDQNNITVTGGTLTNPVVDGSNSNLYTATFTPSPNVSLVNQQIIVDTNWSFTNMDPTLLTATTQVSTYTILGGDAYTSLISGGYRLGRTNVGSTAWGTAGAFAGDFPLYDGNSLNFTINSIAIQAVIGLSAAETDLHFDTIDFGFFNNTRDNGTFHFRESGVGPIVQTTGTNALAVGDEVRIQRSGSTIGFYINDVLRYTSPTMVPATTPLYLDAAFSSHFSAFDDVRIIGNYFGPLYTINTLQPTIDIGTIAGDDIIDTSEDDTNLVVTGTTTAVENGQTVSINLNGTTYSTSTNNDAWSFSLPATTARQLPEGMHTLTASVTNLAGTSASTTRDFTRDLSIPLRVLINDLALSAGETTQVTFLFSNGPVTEFDSNDITVPNGTLTPPTSADNGTTFTATYTPNTGVDDALNRITVGTDWINANGPSTTQAAAEPIIFDAANATLTTITGGNNLLFAGSSFWNSGAQATTYLDGDGSIEFTIGDLSNSRIRVGLANENTGLSPDLLNTSFEFWNGNINTYEFNSRKQTNIATFQTNDTFRLQRIGEDVMFHINGAIVYTASNVVGRIVATTLAGTAGEVNNFQLIRKAASSVNFSVNTSVPTLALGPIQQVPEGTNSVLVTGSTTGVANGNNVSFGLSGQTYTRAVNNNAFSFAMPLVDASAAALAAGTYPLTADVSNSVGTPAAQVMTNVIIEAAVLTQPIASITIDDTDLGVGETANVQIVFASAVSGFDGNDITLTNASLTTGPTSTDNITWTAVLTPMAGTFIAENSLVIGNAWTFTDGSSIAETGLGFVNATNLNDADNGLRAATAGAWGTAGGFAQQTLTADGALSLGFVAGAGADAAAIGFSAADASNNLHYNTIDRGLLFDNTGVSVVENGSVAHNIPLANVDAANDTFVIQRLGISLIYKQNGTTFYSGTTAAGELQVHAAFLNSSAQIRDLQLTGELQTRFDTYDVNTLQPTITLNAISTDNNISSDEDDSGIVLSGTTTMAEDGAAIAASWNGVDYSTTVANDAWWIQIPPADVAALPSGNSTVNVSVTTGGGASANATQVVSHDLTERVVMTISDDYLEFGETAQIGITFATAVENFEIGDLTADDASLSAFSGSGTTWSATLTPDANTFSGDNKVRLGTQWNNTGDAATEQGRLLGSSNAVGVSVDGATLTKYSSSAGWNAGNFSEKTLAVDGSIAFGSSNPANTVAYIGFTDDSRDRFTNVESAMDYALYINLGTINVVENGTVKAANVTSITTGDRLRIERIGAGVRYYKNSTLLYTSLTASTGTLYVDTSFNVPGSVLSDIYLHEYGFAVSPIYTNNTMGSIPILAMNSVSGDNIIDNTEDDNVVYVTGTATNVIDGTALNLTVNGSTYSTNVNANSWSVQIPIPAVAVLPTSNDFIAEVVIEGMNYTASQTVVRDISLPSISFVGGGSSIFTDPTVISQVAINFREAVTNLEIEDFFVESGVLSNLTSIDGGINWIADFKPNPSTDNRVNIISLGNTYSLVSSGERPISSSTPIVWSDVDSDFIVSNNDLETGTNNRPSATTGLNFPIVSGYSLEVELSGGGGYAGMSYLERKPGTEVRIDYGFALGDNNFTPRVGFAVYDRQTVNDVVLPHTYSISRRGERLFISIDEQFRYTFPSSLFGPLYPQIGSFSQGFTVKNARIVQDGTVASDNYKVNTRLIVESVSVLDNDVIINFNQPLNNASLASANIELLVDGNPIFLPSITSSGNQLMITYSGNVIGDTDIVKLSHSTIGGLGLRATNGSLFGDNETILFGNSNNTNFVNPSVSANIIVGSSQADVFDLPYNELIAGAGNDTIYFGIRELASGQTLISGGTGRDTFVKSPLAITATPETTGTGEYIISDFETGSTGDIIDVSQAINYDSAAGDDLIDFVHLVTNGQDTVLRLAHPNRPLNTDISYSSSVFLQNVSGFTVSQLIANGNLIVE